MKTVHERERKKEKNNRKSMGRGGGGGRNTDCRKPHQNHFICLPCSHLIFGVKGKLVPTEHVHVDVFLFACLSLSTILPSYPLVRVFTLLIHSGCSLGAPASSWAPSSYGDLQRAADSHSLPIHAFSVGVISTLQRLCRTSICRL